MRIGICILATNAYFILGVRMIKKFIHFYKGGSRVTFFFFSDTDPRPYFQEEVDVLWLPTRNTDWVDGTNSKFKNILSIADPLEQRTDYAFYFDADTNISKPFTEEWFLGESVGGEHYGNKGHMAIEGRPFDRNPQSMAYIPKDTPLPQTYYYGAFFGGSTAWMLDFCLNMYKWQLLDKEIDYEPAVNDESYINKFFHYTPPSKVVASDQFAFDISDKGGIGETRDVSLDIEHLKTVAFSKKDTVWDIQEGIITDYVTR